MGEPQPQGSSDDTGSMDIITHIVHVEGHRVRELQRIALPQQPQLVLVLPTLQYSDQMTLMRPC